MGSLTAADPATRPAGSRRPAANHSARNAMRIVRPQPAGLRCRVRLADGRVFTGALPPARHRAIQLGMLHADTAELVELTPARAARTASSRSTAGDGPSTTCRAAPPAGVTGWRRCLRTPSRSSPAPTPLGV